MSNPDFYVIGGTVSRDSAAYVQRQADQDLYRGLQAGKLCYILTSRQMGKSSLMVRTTDTLRQEGVAVVVLDLTAIGQNLTAEQWYDGLLSMIGEQLRLEDELEDFWEDHQRLGPLQRWMRAIREILLPRRTGRIVIFIDEIDAVRSLPFSTDEFFAGIREFYNRRTQDPELERLTFGLFGVATPSDLIRDVRTTPFNIGQRIELADFTEAQSTPLARGLGRDEATARILINRVLYWTGGHPYLTQKLCQAVAQDQTVTAVAGVDRLCDELFLSPQARETDDNLLFVRDRMLLSEVDLAALLDLYGQVRAKPSVKADETNPLIDVLRLSGVVNIRHGSLRLRNRIYDHVFDTAWVKANMPEAELRRQKAAFQRGVMRAAVIAVVILGGMSLLTVYAFSQKNRADQALASLTRQSRELDQKNVALQAALEEAHSSTRKAEAKTVEAQEQRNIAETEKIEAQKQRKQATEQKKRADQQRSIAEQAELARQMGDQAQIMESLMRFAVLTPAHDISGDRQLAQRELDIIRQRTDAAGAKGRGPGNYALGRGYLSLLDYPLARQHLEGAYATGFRTPGLDLALAKVLGEFYRQEVEYPPPIEDNEEREAQAKKLEVEYLEPIRLHLTNYLQASSQLSAQEVSYLEGLLAFYRKDYPAALQKAKAAQGQSSWFFEAQWLEGQIYLNWGREQWNLGKQEEYKANLGKAEAAFQAANRIAPSNPLAILGEADIWSVSLNNEVYQGNAAMIKEPFERSLEACDRVLRLDPANEQACLIKAHSYYRLGEFQAKTGVNLRPALEQAIVWAKRTLDLKPNETEAYQVLGSVYRVLGRYELDHGLDPRPSLDLSAANLRQVIRLDPNQMSSYRTLGITYRSMGMYERDHGLDATASFDQSIVQFQKAVQLNPKNASNFANLGYSYRIRGEDALDRGEDPSPFFQQANLILRKSVETRNNYSFGFTHLGILLKSQGQYEFDHGRSPDASFEQADQVLQKAIQLSPKYAFAYHNLGALQLARGQYEGKMGRDPRRIFAQARTNLEKALALNRDYTLAAVNLGNLHLAVGQYGLDHGDDPTGSFDQAKVSFNQALKLNPKENDAFNGLGAVAFWKLEYEVRCGREAGNLMEESRLNFQKSLQINVRHLIPNLYFGLLACRHAQTQLKKGQDPTASLTESRIWLEKATTSKPDFEWARRAQAETELVAAAWALRQGQSPESFFLQAEAALKKAREIRAANPDANCLAAQLALKEAEWEAGNRQNQQTRLARGLNLIEAALAINPHHADSLALKGALWLAQAKAGHNPAAARQAMKIFEEALKANQWLKHQVEPLLGESKKLVEK